MRTVQAPHSPRSQPTLVPGQSEFLPEDEEERPAGLDEQAMAPAIDEEFDLGHLGRLHNLGCWFGTEFPCRSGGHSACSHELKKSTTGHPLTILPVPFLLHILLPVQR